MGAASGLPRVARIMEQMSGIYSRTPILKERLLFLFRRGPIIRIFEQFSV
jgi:hypothetical protein